MLQKPLHTFGEDFLFFFFGDGLDIGDPITLLTPDLRRSFIAENLEAAASFSFKTLDAVILTVLELGTAVEASFAASWSLFLFSFSLTGSASSPVDEGEDECTRESLRELPRIPSGGPNSEKLGIREICCENWLCRYKK